MTWRLLFQLVLDVPQLAFSPNFRGSFLMHSFSITFLFFFFFVFFLQYFSIFRKQTHTAVTNVLQVTVAVILPTA